MSDNNDTTSLDEPVSLEPGIGPQRAEMLQRLGIATVRDLLLHRPRRHEDRSRLIRMSELQEGIPATVFGSILAAGVKRFNRGRKSVFEMVVSDDSARLHCRWWNLPYMERYFKVGDSLFIHGKIHSLKPRTMDHPETEMVEPGEETLHLQRIVPVYRLTEGLSQRWLRRWIWDAIARRPGEWREPLGELKEARMPGLKQAIQWLHFPDRLEQVEQSRERLAFEEWVELLVEIQRRRARLEQRATGVGCGGDNRLIRPFLKQLGFGLTPDQAGVLREIRADMRRKIPMRRLLQGDVGAGKTVVAACSALMALESGFHAALMAPTEILAGQHARLFQKWFEPLGIRVDLYSSSAPDPDPSRMPDPVGVLSVGTHALIQKAVKLPKLGLVIIDEQHRFGVAQREALVRKGVCPHLLVMTATPIPRTLGLTLYGDLDLSIIRHRPSGRGRLRTFLRKADELDKVWDFVVARLAAGERVYVVLPLVEESEALEVKDVTREARHLSERLKPFRVEVMHGRLKPEAKALVMDQFRKGEVQVLVATTVIEVGVDVPEATVMVIQNAERFGLAQLHQLRGRVGRGKAESYCILSTGTDDPEAVGRLNVLVQCNDGFELADADLKIRGPGEFLGRSQSGLPDFRFASVENDLELVKTARARILEHPELWSVQNQKRQGATDSIKTS